ncbi:hypothetical protein ED733_000047 [Metarhizium rileyi]|uniref:Cell wall galactomannoprotein n=1 Tax=Metarhizium rileyi (strain RCEF 4871) TaxID=1649241 RepID=A0A5C6G5Z1_METRR|nr:hypothetical protein ED733_000047 [Metarhizium rileyi]
MQIFFLCLMTLVASAFADDSLATYIQNIAQSYTVLNQGIKDWGGDSATALRLIADAHDIAKVLVSVRVPDNIEPPTGTVLKERQEAVLSLAKCIDDYRGIAIAVKVKVESTIPPVKSLVVAAIKALQTGFITFSTACSVAIPDSQNQAAFGRINTEMQEIYDIYTSGGK